MKYVKTECETLILGWCSGCLYHSGGVLHTPKQPEQTKTLFTTGGQTVAQHQTADWGFFSKNNFIPSAA